MINNEEQNNFNNEKKEKKKHALLILFLIIFLVPIGFGIYALIPERPVPPTPIVTYEVKLVNDYDGGLTLSQNTAYKDRIFSANIEVDNSIIPGKLLPDSLSSSDVLCAGEPISYSYKLNTNKLSARISIPSENVKGNITINVQLVTPTETFPITLKANGGKFEGGFVEKTVYAFVGATLNDLEGYSRPDHYREGYHFTHWELESNREQKLYEGDVIPYAPEGATYVANCELNEIKVNINPAGGAFPSMDINEWLRLTTLYDTKIEEIEGYPGEPSKANHKFLYYRDINDKHYSPTNTVTIPDEWDKNFGLEAIYSEDLFITLDPNGGSFPGGVTPGPFDTYSGITLSELEGYVAPTPPTASKEFTYWTIVGDDTRYQKNTKINKVGSITLIANYSECQHKEVDYTVIDNRLYSVCKSCGAQTLIPDADLSGFNNKFLIIENSENSSDDKYVMHNISEMANIVNTAADHSILDMYFINGNYELGGSRGAGQKVITVNIHGLLDENGNPTASILCTRATEWPYPRYHLFVNFVFENLKMVGEDRYDDGFYFGLYASTITYNHCYFKGKQSLYSDKVICNDCEFDSSNMIDEPDYAIYSYSSYNVEFNRCNFLSQGKAVKIYSEGAATGAVFKFTDCHFAISGVEAIKDKAAIQVDSQHQSDNDPYKVYITRCTQEKYKGGLYADSSTHTTFIVTNE